MLDHMSPKFHFTITLNIDAETAPSNGAIQDELSEQHQHKKAPSLMPNYYFF